MAGGERLTLSEPQFPFLGIEEVVRITRVNTCKALKTAPGTK